MESIAKKNANSVLASRFIKKYFNLEFLKKVIWSIVRDRKSVV